MEPIDYRATLLRRWRLILAVGVVGVLVGAVFPIHVPHPIPHTEYQTSSLVGVTPGGSPPTLSQIDFFTANVKVMSNAAQAVGIKASASKLQKDLTVSSGKKKKKSASPNGTVTIALKQGTAQRAANLTNAFVTSLGNYIQTQLNDQYQNELAAAQQNVCNLEAQLNNVDNEIAAIISPSGAPVPPSSTGGSNSNCNSTTGSGTASNAASYIVGSSTLAPDALYSDISGNGRTAFVLAAGTAASSTPTTAPKSPTTTAPKAPTTTTTTIPNTSRTNPQLADLEAQNQALTSQYVSAVQKVQSLSDTGAAQSGFIVLDPAQASQAKMIPGGLSLLDHHSTRAGIGLLAGIALGAGIAFLLAGFDKRLRSVRRAEETFGFSVVSEIHASPRPRADLRRRGEPLPAPSPVPVMAAPSSAQAEAYRRLRMALELGPLSAGTEGARSEKRTGGQANGNGARLSAVPTTASQGGASSSGSTPLWISEPSGTASSGGQRPGPSEVAQSGGRGHQEPVTLIVSPAAEPTRALVVANLAAAYAEAGLRTHLVTTDDLRSEDGSVPPAGLFQQPTRLGIEEVEAYSTQTQIPGVRRLGMGWLLDGPGQLASSAADVVAICRQLADVVLVEAPSLLSTYDGEALLPVVDRVLVVGEAGMTTVDQARQTGDLLRRDKAPVVGVVFTNLPPKRQELRAARIRAALSSSPARVRARREARASAGLRDRVRRESRTQSPRLARFTEKLRPSARRGPSIMESARQRLQGMFRRTRRG